ncbi:MAG: type II toxin-antitoxin system RelE/ParE family toxin [Actinobacteria bacterium]|nr:type II toxin-antitoxin system RelE/ParE family toxin [Actinomycetota bacterium]
MPFRVEIAPAAGRDLKRLPPQVRSRLEPVILALCDEPLPRGVRKVQGAEDSYRVRVGDYRIIYDFHEEDKLVVVLRVARRWESSYRGI